MILTIKLDIKNAINRDQAIEILQREPWYAGLERGVLNYVDGDKIVYHEPFIKLVGIE